MTGSTIAQAGGDSGGKQPLLSKSAFVAAFDCPVRLQHRRDRLSSNKSEDDFLRLLAEGGMQFEALVRAAYPGREFDRVPGDPSDAHAASLEMLVEAIAAGAGTLHEPTFVVGPYRVRIDMLRVIGNRIELCEIKAKSFAGPEEGWDGQAFVTLDFPDQDGKPQIIGTRGGLKSEWRPYVVDVAFQMAVLERTLLEAGFDLDTLEIVPALVLVNKRASCSVFDARANVHYTVDDRSVNPDDRGLKEWRLKTLPAPGWRSPLIAIVDVTEAVTQIRTDMQQTGSRAARWMEMTLDEIMDDAARIYRAEQYTDPIDERGWKCRDCEYNGGGGPDDGFDRCWDDGAESARRLATLYYGGSYRDPTFGNGPRWVHLRIDNAPLDRTLTVADLDEEVDVKTRAKCRAMQMRAERSGQVELGDGLRDVVGGKLRPKTGETILWFIDFETTVSCLPHFVGDRPYQIVPFQFSCHAVPVRGGLPLWDQTQHREWLFDHRDLSAVAIDVDRAFSDRLQQAVTDPIAGLEGSDSAVFHWATHERTVLRTVRKRLKASSDDVDDTARFAFLDSMIGPGDGKSSGRLIDMLKVAEGKVFHPLQRGRYSIKQLLPAICADANIREMLKTLVDEARDEGSVPIGDAWDPYKCLPPVGEILGGAYRDAAAADGDSDAIDGESLSSGTDAMRAFAALRYGADGTGRTWNEHEKAQLREALRIYCKLDTAAMVAVWRWLVELV
jgi:hypothetical protein